MRIVLRVVAVVLGALGLFTLFGFVVFAGQVGFANVPRFPGLMALTLVLWVVTIIGAPVAAVQLRRLKRSGWMLGLLVFGCGLFYYTVGFALFRGPGASVPTIGVNAAFYLLGTVVLALPSCRRALHNAASPPLQRSGARDARPGR